VLLYDSEYQIDYMTLSLWLWI